MNHVASDVVNHLPDLVTAAAITTMLLIGVVTVGIIHFQQAVGKLLAIVTGVILVMLHAFVLFVFLVV